MSDRWLDAGEKWPKHSNPAWAESIKLAREYQWLLRPLGHRYGKVVCRRTQGQDYCQFTIDSTASGTESVAKGFRKKVRACPHRDKLATASQVDQINLLLDGVDRLMIAVGLCLEGRKVGANALDLVEEVCATLDDAESLETAYAEILEMSEMGRRKLRTGTTSAESEGVELGEPPNIGLALIEAGIRVARADLLTDGISGEASKAVRIRIIGLRLKESEFRAQIDGFGSP